MNTPTTLKVEEPESVLVRRDSHPFAGVRCQQSANIQAEGQSPVSRKLASDLRCYW